MLHELRFYKIAPGHIDDYVDHAGKVALPLRGDRYGKLLGFWSCEIGAVSCAFNLWEHENASTREALRADLQKQEAWRTQYLAHSQPLMRHQFSRLLNPLAALRAPSAPSNMYEMRFLRTHAGKTQELAANLKNALPAALEAATVGIWTGNVGDINEVVHLAAFDVQAFAPSLQSRDWRSFLKTHGALVEDIESSLMMPAGFSPLR